jgi:cell division protein FtsI (penicillin-binding protein 3)
VIVMVLALGVIGGRLLMLQGSSRDRYDAQSRKLLLHTTALAATRGRILDRDGADLAMSVSRPNVFADPKLVVEPAKTAQRLAPILGVSVARLTEQFAAGNRYQVLKHSVEPSVADRVRALKNPGLGIEAATKRLQPNGDLAGPVIGFYNGAKASGGLEHGYDGLLAGRPGLLEAERDPSGREIPATERKLDPAQPGTDLVLTLDRDLQYQVERRLVTEVDQVHAKGGLAMIADVKTGDILAAAVVDGPADGQPAHPAAASESNRLFTTPFEPGSTNKVITIASALERGLISPDTLFSVQSQITKGGQVFADDEPHGTAYWNAKQILTQSSNVGTIEIADKLGALNLRRSIREWGLGIPTAVEFPGESFGQLQSAGQGDGSIMGSLPIGYGVSATAAQTLGVYLTIANGGATRPLRLVDSTIDPEGHRRRAHTRLERSVRVVSRGTASVMTDMLVNVVKEGTGVKAAVPGYTVAGKTGTARKQPYDQHRYMASFAGFAPAESPRLAAIVVLDEPQGQIYGGAVSAPVFSQIMQDALRLERVSPTGTLGATTAAFRGATGKVSATTAP